MSETATHPYGPPATPDGYRRCFTFEQTVAHCREALAVVAELRDELAAQPELVRDVFAIANGMVSTMEQDPNASPSIVKAPPMLPRSLGGKG